MKKVKWNVHRIKNRFARGAVVWVTLPISLMVLAPLVLAQAIYEAAQVFGQIVRQLCLEIWRDIIKTNISTLLFRRVAA